jgi:hypothetical protein
VFPRDGMAQEEVDPTLEDELSIHDVGRWVATDARLARECPSVTRAGPSGPARRRDSRASEYSEPIRLRRRRPDPAGPRRELSSDGRRPATVVLELRGMAPPSNPYERRQTTTPSRSAGWSRGARRGPTRRGLRPHATEGHAWVTGLPPVRWRSLTCLWSVTTSRSARCGLILPRPTRGGSTSSRLAPTCCTWVSRRRSPRRHGSKRR